MKKLTCVRHYAWGSFIWFYWPQFIIAFKFYSIFGLPCLINNCVDFQMKHNIWQADDSTSWVKDKQFSAKAKWCWLCPSTAVARGLREGVGITPNAYWLDSHLSLHITNWWGGSWREVSVSKTRIQTHSSDMYYLVMCFTFYRKLYVRNRQLFQCSPFAIRQHSDIKFQTDGRQCLKCKTSFCKLCVEFYSASFIAAIRVTKFGEHNKEEWKQSRKKKKFCVCVSTYVCTFVTLVINVADFTELCGSDELSSFTRMDW